MAIKLITGIPGSGKSYLAVHHVISNYFTYSKESQEFIVKSNQDGPYTIITNIDNFKIPHIDLNDAIKSMNLTIDSFFTVPNQERISKKYPNIIYIIDEAQRMFPRKNRYQSETWFYFEYHRHLGHDIYIITQDKFLVAQNIILLVEYEIRATKRMLSVFGELRYLIKSDNEIIDRKTLKPSKRIFNLYKSMDAAESDKIKNPMRKYMFFLFIFILICFWLFKKNFILNGKVNIMKSRIANASSMSNHTDSNDIDVKKSSFDQSYKNTSSVPSETPIKLALSYIRHDNELYIYDPVSKQLYPEFLFPRKFQKILHNKKLFLTALYLPSEITKESKPQTSDVENQYAIN